MQGRDQEKKKKRQNLGFHFPHEQTFQFLNNAHRINHLYFKGTISFQELSAF